MVRGNSIWTPDHPILYLPEPITSIFRDHADFLYSDLRDNRLSVVLIPAPEPNFSGHKIRCAESRNPRWYKELYHQYRHFRRDRSSRALDRIRNLKDGRYGTVRYRYDATYRELIRRQLTEGYQTIYGGEPRNEKVNSFFKGSLEDLAEVPF